METLNGTVNRKGTVKVPQIAKISLTQALDFAILITLPLGFAKIALTFHSEQHVATRDSIASVVYRNVYSYVKVC